MGERVHACGCGDVRWETTSEFGIAEGDQGQKFGATEDGFPVRWAQRHDGAATDFTAGARSRGNRDHRRDGLRHVAIAADLNFVTGQVRVVVQAKRSRLGRVHGTATAEPDDEIGFVITQMTGSGFDARDIRVGCDPVEERRRDDGIKKIDRPRRDACIDETFVCDDANGCGGLFANKIGKLEIIGAIRNQNSSWFLVDVRSL